MDLAPLAALHPTLDTERRLLVLSLDHGKANEIGSEQLGVRFCGAPLVLRGRAAAIGDSRHGTAPMRSAA